MQLNVDAHSSITNAGLPNITLLGSCPAEGGRWAAWCGRWR